MENKSKITALLLGLLSSGMGVAQPDSTQRDSLIEYANKQTGKLMKAIVVDGDTIPFMALDEVLLVEHPTFDSEQARRRYEILKRKVKKVYPYAVIAGNKLDSLNLLLERLNGGSWKRNRFIKDFQEYMEEKFETELRQLTHSEGQILSKLIYRETGYTTYELIQEYRSGWNAFWWNIAANYNDISLKTPYDPEESREDRLIQIILKNAFAKGELEEREPITELKNPPELN